MKRRKPRILSSDYQIKKAAEIECEKYLTEKSMEISKNAAYRVLAITFLILARDFRYGAKRMNMLKDKIECELITMKLGVLGRKYTELDIVQHLKENYGVDFEKSCVAPEIMDEIEKSLEE